MPEPCPDLQRTSGSRCCSEVCSGEEAAGHLLAVTAAPRPALRGHRARLPPEGSLEKQAAGLSPSPGWGGEWSRTGQLGVTMASCAALRLRQGSGTQLGTLSRLPRVGGLGNPGHAPPHCPGGRRVRVAGARGDESGGQSEAAGRTSCRAEQGRRRRCGGGGARVSLGTQARPGPTSSVLRGCSRLTFAGGFCTLACEGRWSKSGPRPRGHEPSD